MRSSKGLIQTQFLIIISLMFAVAVSSYYTMMMNTNALFNNAENAVNEYEKKTEEMNRKLDELEKQVELLNVESDNQYTLY